MAAILNSAIWDSAILHKKDFTNSFSLNLMMAVILNCTILDSASLVFPLKLTHNCQDWFPPFAQKKNFTHTSLPIICTKNFSHSTWLNLMKTAIFNSAMFDSDTAILYSDTLLSSLRFTQKHLLLSDFDQS